MSRIPIYEQILYKCRTQDQEDCPFVKEWKRTAPKTCSAWNKKDEACTNQEAIDAFLNSQLNRSEQLLAMNTTEELQKGIIAGASIRG